MKRSKHSLSHYNLFSCDMGELIPIGAIDVLPGDTVQHATSLLVRLSPLLAPVMHPVHVRVHHWFVPNRLLWDNWEDFITGGSDGNNSSEHPYIDFGTGGTTVATGDLADYFGVPPGITATSMPVNALPFRAYALIYNEWYRDQDLVSEIALDTGDGDDTTTSTALLAPAWEKDYFTTARPWTQKGPTVTIPLQGNAPVTAVNYASQTVDQVTSDANGEVYMGNSVIADRLLEADMSNVTAADINDLRLAFALQRYEEARARFGSRYTEYLRYLGVRSSDARLQRPEYLGGGKQTIQFSEVLQTAEGTDPVGELRGHGISAVRSRKYRRFFEEHGWVISLLSVRPKTIYTQGIHRSLYRPTKEDYWQKELQHIGQQGIYRREIYAVGSSPLNTWGFQDRYDEYRRHPSGVHGEFRDSTLDFWHMARKFASLPSLNSDFVTANPTDRIFASSAADTLWIMANHSIQARRMVAKSGTSYIF